MVDHDILVMEGGTEKMVCSFQGWIKAGAWSTCTPTSIFCVPSQNLKPNIIYTITSTPNVFFEEYEIVLLSILSSCTSS